LLVTFIIHLHYTVNVVILCQLIKRFFFVFREKGMLLWQSKKNRSTCFDSHELLLFSSRFGLSFLILTTIAIVSRPYNAAINAYHLHLRVSIAYEGISAIEFERGDLAK